MIKEHKGNLLSVTEGIIVHGCNAQGVMGSGVARAIKEKWPKVYENYRFNYSLYLLGDEFKRMEVGSWSLIPISTKLAVVNAITQEYYGRSSKVYVDYKAIEKIFITLNKFILGSSGSLASGYYPKKLHFPKIGAGLGGGSWDIISDIIDNTVDDSIEKNLWIL